MQILELQPYTISLNNQEQLTRISKAREQVFTDKERIYLPANVITELFRQEKLLQIYEVCYEELKARIGFTIYIATLDKNQTIPIHACLEIVYKNMAIAGPVFISLTHKVLTHPNIPATLKAELVTQSIQKMRYYTDGVVIGMPQRKENSFTDSIFTNPSTLRGLPFSDLHTKKLFYFFEMSRKCRELIHDPQFQKICSIVYSLWVENLDEVKVYLPEYKLNEHDYISNVMLGVN